MKEVSGDGHLSSWGLSLATWSGHHYWGLCDMVERGSRIGASHSVGALGRDPEVRGLLLGTLKDI